MQRQSMLPTFYSVWLLKVRSHLRLISLLSLTPDTLEFIDFYDRIRTSLWIPFYSTTLPHSAGATQQIFGQSRVNNEDDSMIQSRNKEPVEARLWVWFRR